MTTATEHHDAQLAAIKERHAALAAKFSDPAVTRVGPDEMVAATFAQVGLSEVKVDPLGRFWRVDGTQGAEMVFDPGPRAIGYSHGDRALPDPESLEAHESMTGSTPEMRGVHDPDDTQAAQGFKAREG